MFLTNPDTIPSRRHSTFGTRSRLRSLEPPPTRFTRQRSTTPRISLQIAPLFRNRLHRIQPKLALLDKRFREIVGLLHESAFHLIPALKRRSCFGTGARVVPDRFSGGRVQSALVEGL